MSILGLWEEQRFMDKNFVTNRIWSPLQGEFQDTKRDIYVELCWTFCTGAVVWLSCLRRLWFKLSIKITLIKVLTMVTFMKQILFWTEEFLLSILLCVFKFMPFLGFVNLSDVKNCKTSFFFFFCSQRWFQYFLHRFPCPRSKFCYSVSKYASLQIARLRRESLGNR